MEPNPYEAPKELPEGSCDQAASATTSPDLISTLATIAVPAFLVFRLLTGGWAFFVLLAMCCVVVAWIHWRLGFFNETE